MTTAAWQPRPARNYKWATASAGNQIAATHRAYSERSWRPIAEQLVADAIEASPWLARPLFRWSVEAWAKAEARAHLLDVWLDEKATAVNPGDLDDAGVPRPAALLADRMHTRAAHLRATLGLDPQAMARLLASFSVVSGGDDVLAALRAEGAALVAASEARAVLEPPDDSGAESEAERLLDGPA